MCGRRWYYWHPLIWHISGDGRTERGGEWREREREPCIQFVPHCFIFILLLRSCQTIFYWMSFFFFLCSCCVWVCVKIEREIVSSKKKQQQQIHSIVGPTLNTIDFIEICMTSLYIVVMHITYGRFHSAFIFFLLLQYNSNSKWFWCKSLTFHRRWNWNQTITTKSQSLILDAAEKRYLSAALRYTSIQFSHAYYLHAELSLLCLLIKTI